MTKRTFKHLAELDRYAGYLFQTHSELQDSKFGYAYKRFSEKSYKGVYQQYVDALGDIRIDNALEDPVTKAILRTPPGEKGRGFQYSKEGLKAVIKAETELDADWENKEFDVGPFIVSEIPFTPSDEGKGLLLGLLIDEKTISTPAEVPKPESK